MVTSFTSFWMSGLQILLFRRCLPGRYGFVHAYIARNLISLSYRSPWISIGLNFHQSAISPSFLYNISEQHIHVMFLPAKAAKIYLHLFVHFLRISFLGAHQQAAKGIKCLLYGTCSTWKWLLEAIKLRPLVKDGPGKFSVASPSCPIMLHKSWLSSFNLIFPKVVTKAKNLSCFQSNCFLQLWRGFRKFSIRIWEVWTSSKTFVSNWYERYFK